MEQIKYFGNSIGEKTTHFNKIISQVSDYANAKGIKMPAYHFISYEQLCDLSKYNVSLPVKVAQINDKSTYFDFQLLSDDASVKEYINTADSDSFVIFKPTPLTEVTSKHFYDDCSAFISNNAILIYNAGNNYKAILPIQQELSDFGISEGTIIKCVFFGNTIVFENIYINNAHLKEEMDVQDEMSSDHFEEMRAGFLAGFNSEYSSAKIGYLEQYKLYNFPAHKHMRMHGYNVGLMARHIYYKYNFGLISSLKQLNQDSIIKYELFCSVVEMHNAFVNREQKSAINAMKALAGAGNLNIHDLILNSIVSQKDIEYSEEYINNNKWKEYSKKLDLAVKIKETNKDIVFDIAQFRILSDSSIRFQAKQIIANINIVMEDGKESSMEWFSKSEIEIDLNLKITSKIQNLNFDQKSHAGTHAMYSKLIIDGDWIVSEQDPTLKICDKKTLIKRLGGY